MLRMSFWLRVCGVAIQALAFASAPLAVAQIQGGVMATTQPQMNKEPVTVTGVVVNAVTEAPIPRVLVRLGDRAMLTDHEGKFEFDQYAQTGGMLQMTKPGYYSSLDYNTPTSRYIAGAQLAQPMHLRLYPEAILTGTVTKADGTPLQISVSAYKSVFSDNGQQWFLAGTALANDRGEFRLPVPAGEYRLETGYAPYIGSNDVIMPAVAPGDSSSNASGVIRIFSGEEQRFELHPVAGPSYAVMVTLEPPQQGYLIIRVHQANGTAFPIGHLPGPASDVYKLMLPSGSYTLTATNNSPQGMETAEAKVTVADRDVSGIQLQFSPVPVLPLEVNVDRGVTSDNTSDTAPPNPRVLGLMLFRTQSSASDGPYPVYPANQKDGTLAFQVPPGSYRLATRNSGGGWYVESATYGDRDLLRQDLVIAQGAGGLPIELTVSNQMGTLSGSACSGRTLTECHVYLFSASPSATPMTQVSVSFTKNYTGARGFYSVNLAPGYYRVIAFDHWHSFSSSAPDVLAPYASHVRTVEIHAGEKATLDLDAVTEAEIKP